MIKKNISHKGFTLLELIFVVIILGIIASLALPNLNFTKDNAKESAIREDIRVITQTVRGHFLINDSLDKFTDILTLNPNIWIITDKSLNFKSNNLECIKIELNDSTKILKITHNDNNQSEICKNLSTIPTESYNLN